MRLLLTVYRKIMTVCELIIKKITNGKRLTLPNGFYDIYHYIVERKIESDLSDLIQKFKGNTFESEVPQTNNVLDNKIVWVMWWQKKDIPILVQSNIKMMKKNLRYEVILLNEENMSEYLDIPDKIYEGLEEGNVTFASFSDYIRTAILYKFGGLWLDSTILVLNEDNFINHIDFNTTPLITIKGVNDFGHKFIAKNHWTVYCLGGIKGQSFFNFVNLGLRHYLIAGEKIPDYFLVDYLLDICYRHNIGGFQDDVMNLEPENNNVEMLARVMNTVFDNALFESITRNSSIFKLSAKKRYYSQLDSGALTFYGALKRKEKIV